MTDHEPIGRTFDNRWAMTFTFATARLRNSKRTLILKLSRPPTYNFPAVQSIRNDL